ncbi:hypothetical protein M0R45_009859 [Rubus argutus]|uniref:F-box domain-containing protein n=1 Tax=Rubus argutus TaxID=59490 RepID=A0AAW1Y6C0_RUBAR
MINMDDLPEDLLAEILYRVPCPKSLFRCKYVSKRWFHLISAPYFVRRLKQKPMISTLIVEATVDICDPRLFEFLPMCEKTSNLSLSFYNTQANVVGTFNDLVLCNYHWGDYDSYSICNPYTKQWLYLPPIPKVQGEVVGPYVVYKGFLCDPLNPQRWNFVLLVPVSPGSAFHLQVWSSETRAWRESVISLPSPRAIRPVPHFMNSTYGGVAYNGMLYWICWDGSATFTIEFDPFGSDDVSDHKCRFIEGPGFVAREDSMVSICAFPKCVRVCIQSGYTCFSVWELKEEVDNAGDKLKKWHLIVDRVSLNQFSSEFFRQYSDNRIVLGFHPTNEDILYMRTLHSIVTYNIREKTVKRAIEAPEHLEARFIPYEFVFPFVLPWLPTPVPRL